ncbi:NADase-type glycan-binding domain-containing protein [Streptomyces sp. NBC_01497]|uniref:NADase-type glycan-binding domain-containing protein n=1 Tax=Streptomyces sp. NBC_01497 TaxID=2903885 RepID=UPI002E2F2D4B|nr:zinc ribbon domain-containing protein [Streptomyces sp. NBC_01497]
MSQASGDPRGEQRMVVCDQCGTHQDPAQAFCDSCNAVLRWSPGTPAPAPSARPAPERTPVAQGAPGAPGQLPPEQGPAGHLPPEQPLHGRTAASAPAAPSGPADPWNASPAGGGYGAPPAGSGYGYPPRADGFGPPPGAGGFGPPPGAAPAASAPWAGPSAHGTHSGGHAMNDDTLETATPAVWPGGAGAALPAQEPPATAAAAGGRPPVQDPGIDTERARALLVPLADPRAPQDLPPSVAPVLPGRPEPARPQVRTVGEQPFQGGIACPWCATPNPPERHFCSRCAMSMGAGPENAARRSWWRRMVDYRNREEPWAGDRPRLRRQLGRILRWVAGAAAIALVVTGLFHAGEGIDAVRDHFSKRVAVAPDSYKASHSYEHQGPGLAFDKVSNTWWGPGYSGSGQGQWLEAHFQEPVTLLDVGITPGESTHADTLSKSALPHRVEATITTDDGKVSTKELLLDPSSGFQSRDFRFHDVTSVRFTLETAYNTDGKKQVAIAEIEFFGASQDGAS